MPVRTYDPKAIALTVGGVPITGFADGTFVLVERANDSFTKVVGADGETSRAKSQDRSGRITITLAQTSNSNDYLSSVMKRDEEFNAGVVPIQAKDVTGASTVFSGSGWVVKPPNVEYGKEINNREWMFDCADLTMFVGGNVPL